MLKRIFTLLVLSASTALAVSTSNWTHTSEADFKPGTFDQVVATNLGDLKLSRAVKMLLEQDPQVSAVYAMVEGKDGTIYAGTGPNGILLRLKQGVATHVLAVEKAANIQSLLTLPDGSLLIGTVGEVGRVMRIEKPDAKEPVATEFFKADGVQYIWGLTRTDDGNIYVATGPNGQLFEVTPEGKQRVVWDSQENNLTAMVSDGRDLLYIGSDPNGLVYRVNRKTGDSFVLYDAAETEISGIVIDKAGLIYVATGEALEGAAIPSLTPEPAGRPEGVNPGAALPADPPKEPAPPKLPDPTPGQPKPIPKTAPDPSPQSRAALGQLRRQSVAMSVAHRAPAMETKIAFTPRTRPLAVAVPLPQTHPAIPLAPQKPQPAPKPPTPGPGPHPASQPATHALPPGFPFPEVPSPLEPAAVGNAVYRIDRDGFVTEVFRQNVTIFGMVAVGDDILISTGSEGQILQIRPKDEETVVVAKVDAKQVTCLLPAKDGNVYLGLSNAGGLAAMSSGFAAKGTFTSPVMDAGQVSRFGKIRLNGTLPDGTSLTVATRSGNVKDATEKSWAAWSAELPAIQFLQTPSPSARFLQYRLTLTSKEGSSTPVVEDVNVAYQVPNLSPVIRAIKATPEGAVGGPPTGMPPNAAQALAAFGLADPGIGASPAPAAKPTPSHKLTVSWEASDPNGDALTYSLFFRTGSESPWIALKENMAETTYEWDTHAVADGRYQVRVIASDAAANVPGTGKSASRVSDPVVIDNNPPVIGDVKAELTDGKFKVFLRVVDRTSVVASADYSVDSARDWQAFLPSDNIWDSPEETATFTVAGLAPGPHQITVRAFDSSGNASYETLNVTLGKPAVPGK